VEGTKRKQLDISAMLVVLNALPSSLFATMN